MTDWTRAHIDDWARGHATPGLATLAADDREYFEVILDSLLDDDAIETLIADSTCVRARFFADLLCERLCAAYRVTLPSPSALTRAIGTMSDAELSAWGLAQARRLRAHALRIERLRHAEHPLLRAIARDVLAFRDAAEAEALQHWQRMRETLSGRRDGGIDSPAPDIAPPGANSPD